MCFQPIIQKIRTEDAMILAKERLMDCVGPRGIQTLVEQRMKEGVVLPFRVSIRHNSRLALVSVWEADLDLSEEVGKL